MADIIPESSNEAIDKLFAEPDKGPLKPLAEAQAEDDEGDDGETERIEAEPDEEPEVEYEDEDEEPEPGSTDEVLAEAAALLKELEAPEVEAEAKEPEKKEPEAEAKAPAHIQNLLDSDDPGIREAGEAMLVQHQENVALKARLDTADQRAEAQAVERGAEIFSGAIEATAKLCDPPLTPIEQEWLEMKMTEGDSPMVSALVEAAAKNGRSPKQIASLTVVAGVQKLLPGRLKAMNGKTDTARPKGGAEGNRPVVRVTAEGPEKGALDTRRGSAGPKPTPEKIPANESLDQAISRGADRPGLRWS
jgi:hypothetical protein